MTEHRVVRMAHPDDMAHVKNIWQYAFSDSAAFVDWYFNTYARVDEIVVAEIEGKVSASLQLIEETLVVSGEPLHARYIVGIDCLPEARGLGLTRAMMDYVFTEYAKRQPVDVFLLMPFEAGFYYPYGFIFGTFHARMQLPVEAFTIGQKEVGTYRRIALVKGWSEDFVKQLDDLYQAWQKHQSDFYLQRDARQWQALLEDLRMERGHAVIWINGDDVCEGYLLYHLSESGVHIREMGTVSAAARNALYYFIASHRSQNASVHWSAPQDEWMVAHRSVDKAGVSLYPFMMYRIQSAFTIAHFAQNKPQKDYIFQVEDDDNVYLWRKGTRDIVATDAYRKSATVFSHSELTQMVFASRMFLQSPVAERDTVKREIGELFGSLYNYVNTYF